MCNFRDLIPLTSIQQSSDSRRDVLLHYVAALLFVYVLLCFCSTPLSLANLLK